MKSLYNHYYRMSEQQKATNEFKKTSETIYICTNENGNVTEYKTYEEAKEHKKQINCKIEKCIRSKESSKEFERYLLKDFIEEV